MTFFDSSKSRFLIDDTGGTQRDLSLYITEISGLPGDRLLRELTGLSDSGAVFLPSVENSRISARGLFDDTASSGPDAVLGPLRAHSSAVDFEYGPEGTASGAVKYSGTCWVRNYELRSKVGRLVAWQASMQVEGTVTRGSY
ncbi:MAG: hypothetical protein QF898_02835 [SAR202 cluster bacterium]|jgi:hypothetical protein|nr:hypothetical protein [SAR202 cluster bacterium]MDP6714467.1 hypothetical protein [SAR202 cluster bacterium]